MKNQQTPQEFFFFLKQPKKYGGRKAWKQIKCWEGKKKKKAKKNRDDGVSDCRP